MSVVTTEFFTEFKNHTTNNFFEFKIQCAFFIIIRNIPYVFEYFIRIIYKFCRLGFWVKIVIYEQKEILVKSGICKVMGEFKKSL